MIWMGTATQTFLPPVRAVNASILDQTMVNAEFLVQDTGARATEVADAR